MKNRRNKNLLSMIILVVVNLIPIIFVLMGWQITLLGIVLFSLSSGLFFYLTFFILSCGVIWSFYRNYDPRNFFEIIYIISAIIILFTTVFGVIKSQRDKENGVNNFLCKEYQNNIDITKNILNGFKISTSTKEIYINQGDSYLFYDDSAIEYALNQGFSELINEEVFNDRNRMQIVNNQLNNFNIVRWMDPSSINSIQYTEMIVDYLITNSKLINGLEQHQIRFCGEERKKEVEDLYKNIEIDLNEFSKEENFKLIFE